MNQMQPAALLDKTRTGGVLTLTLGAAPAHPLSLAMIDALHTALRDAATDDTVRVILLHGAGRIFCAGHDLKEIARHRGDADKGRAFLQDLFARCGAMMQALTMSPRPVIALVEGIATAGGLQLVAACDLAFATPDATFCLPGVANGGFCTTPAVAVGRAIGRKQVMEMALTGDRFGADWALSAGLINRILPAADLLTVAQDFAQTLATRHAPAIAAGKQALYRQLEMPLAQAYDHATEVMLGHFMDPVRMAREPRR